MPTQTGSNIDIESYLTKQKNIIDNNLKRLFEESKNFSYPGKLWDAIKYSLLDGGKRIRGIFCLATLESINNLFLEDCLTLACSIEIVHAMSLIHDDLPSMDNDDLRRGKPSCHKAFGEAIAILAGDAMLSLAFQLVTEHTKQISSYQKLNLINILSRAFTLGLVPGQVLDLMNSENEKDLKLTENIYKLKTAELIKASVLCGAIIGLDSDNQSENKLFKPHEKEKILRYFSSFGLKVGIAFQIIDDILDITSDTKTLGKTSGKDKEQKKGTYPMILGIEQSKKISGDLIAEAKLELKKIPFKTQILSELSEYVINRIN
ncbi:MAG: hypothetical protein A3I68_07940 [Candidatus Melainabacteria bacterium RIFCSPLOWO2_02_FULL_35_15]|nr:MAG: hypothetical protein A3F80_02590 [Candidatus Melainabacteria bacterium RIFCSPLOWO2_12_FULL_35_11]OGI14219.1 MAG: hypothetical protein A3I68_07940 [Candidatus Melainabacteria bacterium RIFCSPLOWO2_02_FULL_35_15]